MAPEFLTFLDDIDLISQDRLAAIQETAEAQSEALLSRIETLFNQAQEAEAQNQNAFGATVAKFGVSVEQMEAAITRLQNIQVTVHQLDNYEVGG